MEWCYDGLEKKRIMRGRNIFLLGESVLLEAEEWAVLWQERLEGVDTNKETPGMWMGRIERGKAEAAARSGEAQERLSALRPLLLSCLMRDCKVGWAEIKIRGEFLKPVPIKPEIDHPLSFP